MGATMNYEVLRTAVAADIARRNTSQVDLVHFLILRCMERLS